jgi:hypothetical protein
VHISYIDTASGELRYATNIPGTDCTNPNWNCETVDIIGTSFFPNTSIAVGSNNKSHIAYSIGFSTSKYAINESGSWVITDLPANELWGPLSIAVDLKNNSAHITNTMSYATNESGSWVITPIPTGCVETYITDRSIAIDPYSKVHISCTDHILTYATNESGSWETTTFPEAYCGYPSIALDSNNKVHIAALTATGDVYTTNESGSWVTTLLTFGQSFGREDSSLALDSNNNVYIAFTETDGLKYAVFDRDDDGIPDISDNCPYVFNPDQIDTDSDEAGDVCDNCREAYNPDQRDTNSDEDDNTSLAGIQHYGNLCDPDFNNNGLVGLEDFNTWRTYYRQTVPPAPDDVDLNGNGIIDLGDHNIWRSYYRSAPGPGIGD